MTATWLLLEVTAILALALIGVRLARRSRAAVRHVLLAGAFAVLLILPVASQIAPAIRVEVPAAVHAAIAPLDREPDLPAIDDASRAATPASLAGAAAPLAPEGPSWSWPSLSTVLVGVWIAGTTMFLLPVVIGLWQVRTLRRTGLPWRSGGQAANPLASDAGIRRHIDVLLHESVPGPMTCGLLHPAIVLPRDAEAWPQEDLQRAIVHELEHVRRADWLSHCLARAVAACYWFHPIVWIAWRQLVLEAERACDDAVIQKAEATAYADQLVVLAQRLSSASNQPQLAMANRRDLTTRVRAVLDSRQQRGRAGVAWVAASVAACALLVLTMSPLRIVSAAAQAPASANKFDVVSIKPCPGLPPPGSGRMVAPQAAQTSPGRVRWSCISLAELIDQAYARPDTPLLNMNMMSLMPGVEERPGSPRRIRGGPSWITSDRWTIEATASGEAGKPQPYGAARYLLPAMNDALKAMLADRFQLKLRRATEQQPMYALTVVKGGHKLAPATPDDCFDMIVDAATGLRTKPPGSDDKTVCGIGRKFGRGNSIMEYRGTSLNAVAQNLSIVMDRFVLDQTGVDGKFTFTLKYTPDDHTPSGGPNLVHAGEVGRAAGAAMSAAPVTPPEGDAPNIFKALEALGLKLDPTKGPAEYFVIDSVQKPRPDEPAVAADAGMAGRPAVANSDNTPDGSSPNQNGTAKPQNPAAPGPVKFDVVSINHCAGLPPGEAVRGAALRSAQVSPGYVQWPCVTVSQLINQAYSGAENPLLNILAVNRAREDSPKRVRGGPSWVYSDLFVVEAKSASITTPDEGVRVDSLAGPSLAMLRALLEDRFQLKLRRATEQQSMYGLAVASGGLRLTPTGAGDCWVRPPGTPATAMPARVEGKPSCGSTASYARNGNQFVEATGVTLKNFARYLSGVMDRYVLDHTSVDGTFSFPLEFAPDDHTPGINVPLSASGSPAGASGSAPRGGGATIFKALEALGLKLEPTKGPAEYLVIDSVQRPKPNRP